MLQGTHAVLKGRKRISLGQVPGIARTGPDGQIRELENLDQLPVAPAIRLDVQVMNSYFKCRQWAISKF